jgi:hypothetical protein
MVISVEQLAQWKPGKPKHWERTYPSAALSTTNPTRSNEVSNRGRGGGKPATTRLSYDTALF